MTTIDTIHASKMQTQILARYLEQFSGIPDHELSHVNFEWLAANGALANARIADALERVLLEKDSWLAIASKLAEIQAKISLLEKEVSAVAQAFVDSSSQLHFKFMELEALVSLQGDTLSATTKSTVELRADVDTLLGKSAGEQDFDPFLVGIEEDDVRLSVE